MNTSPLAELLFSVVDTEAESSIEASSALTRLWWSPVRSAIKKPRFILLKIEVPAVRLKFLTFCLF